MTQSSQSSPIASCNRLAGSARTRKRHPVLRLLPTIPVFILTACGNSDQGGALTIESTATAVAIAAPTLSQGDRIVALASEDSDIALVWAQGAGLGKSELVAQLFTSDFRALGDQVEISGTSEDTLTQIATCRDSGGWSTVWSDVLPNDLFTEDVTLDTANVHARWTWPPTGAQPIRVTPNEIGAQTKSDLTCFDGGRRAVTWAHECVAVKRVGDGFFYFSPPECATEPADGSYLGIFDSNGGPESAPILLSMGGRSRAPVASVSSGGFVVLVESSIQIRSETGELLEEHFEPGVDLSSAALDCAGHICAAAVVDDALRVWIIDTRSLAAIYVQTVSTTRQIGPNETLRPVDASLACQRNGVCLVTWLLLHETIQGDQVLNEPDGIYARAMDANIGRLGPAVLLFDPESTDRGVLVAAQDGERFATARIAAGAIMLDQFRVR